MPPVTTNSLRLLRPTEARIVRRPVPFEKAPVVAEVREDRFGTPAPSAAGDVTATTGTPTIDAPAAVRSPEGPDFAGTLRAVERARGSLLQRVEQLAFAGHFDRAAAPLPEAESEALIDARLDLVRILDSLSGGELEALALATGLPRFARSVAPLSLDLAPEVALPTGLRARLSVEVAAPEGATDGFAGLTFATPVTLEVRDDTVLLPPGTEISSAAGQLPVRVSGENLHLPRGVLLDGPASIHSRGLELHRGSRASVGPISVRAEHDNTPLRVSNGTLVAGPGLHLEAASQSSTSMRFSLQHTRLPDGRFLVRGTGTFRAEGESVRAELDRGATVRHFAPRTSIALDTRGAGEDKLVQGSADLRDGRVLRIGPNSLATLDGVTFESKDSAVAYRFSPPGDYRFGAGITVVEVPQDRRLTLSGPDLTVHSSAGVIDLLDGEIGFAAGRIVSAAEKER